MRYTIYKMYIYTIQYNTIQTVFGNLTFLQKVNRLWGFNTFYMLNSVEHDEFYHAHKF